MNERIRELYEAHFENKKEENFDLKGKKKKKGNKYLRKYVKLLKKQNKYLKKLAGLDKSHDVKKKNKGTVSKTSFLTKLGDACVKAVPAVLTTCATAILTFVFNRKSDKRTLRSSCVMA